MDEENGVDGAGEPIHDFDHDRVEDQAGHYEGPSDSAVDALRDHALKDAERIAEALVFASAMPVPQNDIADKLPKDIVL